MLVDILNTKYYSLLFIEHIVLILAEIAFFRFVIIFCHVSPYPQFCMSELSDLSETSD